MVYRLTFGKEEYGTYLGEKEIPFEIARVFRNRQVDIAIIHSSNGTCHSFYRPQDFYTKSIKELANEIQKQLDNYTNR